MSVKRNTHLESLMEGITRNVKKSKKYRMLTEQSLDDQIAQGTADADSAIKEHEKEEPSALEQAAKIFIPAAIGGAGFLAGQQAFGAATGAVGDAIKTATGAGVLHQNYIPKTGGRRLSETELRFSQVIRNKEHLEEFNFGDYIPSAIGGSSDPAIQIAQHPIDTATTLMHGFSPPTTLMANPSDTIKGMYDINSANPLNPLSVPMNIGRTSFHNAVDSFFNKAPATQLTNGDSESDVIAKKAAESAPPAAAAELPKTDPVPEAAPSPATTPTTGNIVAPTNDAQTTAKIASTVGVPAATAAAAAPAVVAQPSPIDPAGQSYIDQAKAMGNTALNTAKQAGGQAWNTTKKVGTDVSSIGGNAYDKAMAAHNSGQGIGSSLLAGGNSALDTTKQIWSGAGPAEKFGLGALGAAGALGAGYLAYKGISGAVGYMAKLLGISGSGCEGQLSQVMNNHSTHSAACAQIADPSQRAQCNQRVNSIISAQMRTLSKNCK